MVRKGGSLGSAVKAIEHTTVFPGGAAGKTTLPEEDVSLQSGRSGLLVLTEERTIAGGDVIVLSVSVVRPGLEGERGMRDRYGRTEVPLRVCHDIRKPTVEVLVLLDPAEAREAFRCHRGIYRGRGGLGVRRVNPWLPPATSRMGGRAADANCPV